MVNLSLQNLSSITQSGSKIPLEEAKNARNTNAKASKVDDATRTAKKGLARLREITPDDLDVERAACSIVGKLITLEVVRDRPPTVWAVMTVLLQVRRRDPVSRRYVPTSVAHCGHSSIWN